MLFGSACTEEDKAKVREVLKFDIVAHEEKHLGLATSEGRMKKDQFMSTKQ
jgi:hypothetical protein